jgi:hypothetical protein
MGSCPGRPSRAPGRAAVSRMRPRMRIVGAGGAAGGVRPPRAVRRALAGGFGAGRCTACGRPSAARGRGGAALRSPQREAARLPRGLPGRPARYAPGGQRARGRGRVRHAARDADRLSGREDRGPAAAPGKGAAGGLDRGRQSHRAGGALQPRRARDPCREPRRGRDDGVVCAGRRRAARSRERARRTHPRDRRPQHGAGARRAHRRARRPRRGGRARRTPRCAGPALRRGTCARGPGDDPGAPGVARRRSRRRAPEGVSSATASCRFGA